MYTDVRVSREGRTPGATMYTDVRVSREGRMPGAAIPAGKKNPPCGGLKTLFSVGGAFTTTVHDKIFSEIVPDVPSVPGNHVTVHC